MFGDFPPSSSVTGMMFSEAYCIMSRPVLVSPVKAILAILFEEANGFPASIPNPFTTFKTPGGKISATNSAKSMIVAGVCSAGLRTTQLPAAKAGANFQAAINKGKFQGIICPTTPSGSKN